MSVQIGAPREPQGKSRQVHWRKAHSSLVSHGEHVVLTTVHGRVVFVWGSKSPISFGISRETLQRGRGESRNTRYINKAHRRVVMLLSSISWAVRTVSHVLKCFVKKTNAIFSKWNITLATIFLCLVLSCVSVWIRNGKAWLLGSVDVVPRLCCPAYRARGQWSFACLRFMNEEPRFSALLRTDPISLHWEKQGAAEGGELLISLTFFNLIFYRAFPYC